MNDLISKYIIQTNGFLGRAGIIEFYYYYVCEFHVASENSVLRGTLNIFHETNNYTYETFFTKSGGNYFNRVKTVYDN